MSDVQSLQTRAVGIEAEVRTLAIVNDETFTAAGAILRDIATYIKRVGEVMNPVVAAAHNAHRVAVGQRDALLRPATLAKTALGSKMVAYELEQSRLRREAEETQRRERERLEREAREAAAAEQRRLLKAAEDARLESAVALEAAGDTQAAQRLVEAPIVVPVVNAAPVVLATPPPPALPKAEGTSFRTDHGWRVTNEALVPRIYLMLNESAIGKVYRALGPKTDIPGTEYVEKRIAITRADTTAQG